VQSEKGISLVSVLMASAILSVIAVAFTTLLQSMQAGVNSSKFRSDADVLNEEMRALLSSPAACTATFGGLAVNTGSKIDIAKVTNGAAAPATIEFAAGKTYGDRSVLIKKMTLQDFVAGAVPSKAQMTLSNAMLTAKEASGPQNVSREIKLSLELDSAKKITTCIPLAKMSDGIWQRSISNLNSIFYAPPPIGPLGGVGVGIADPSALLDIKGSGTGNNPPDYPAIRITNSEPQAGDWASGRFNFAALEANAGNGATKGRIGASLAGDDSSVFIMSTTNHPLAFLPFGVERMRLTPSGQLGLGIKKPFGTNVGELPANSTAMHINSVGSQGMLIVSGKGDGNETYSSVNLIDDGTASWRANSWTLAHKKQTGTSLENSFEIAHWVGNVMSSPFIILKKDKAVFNAKLPGEAVMVVNNGAAGGNSGIEFANGAGSVGHNASTGLTYLFSNGGNGVALGNNGAAFKVLTNGDASLTGNLSVGGSVSAASDERLKTNIAPLDGYDLAMKLRGVRFRWKKNGQADIGLVAQDVEQVAPELVVTDRTGMKSVKYGNVSAILLEAFKTLSAENKHLQKQVDELNAHINALQKDNK
jgi:hypothetical protein